MTAHAQHVELICGQTCRDEKELLGLGAHHVGRRAVVASKVALGIGVDLGDGKKNEVRRDAATEN